MKKLYVIVKYNYAYGGYLSYAVDGLVFKTEREANEYLKYCGEEAGVEELELYKKEGVKNGK